MLKGESPKATVLVGITYLVVALAFFSSLVARSGTIGEEWRTVGVLEANLGAYMQWVWDVLEFGVLPVAVGLVLCIIDYVVLGRPVRRLSRVSLFVAGVFFVVLGIHYSLTTYFSFVEAADLAVQWNVKGIDGSLRIIYTWYEVVGFLWLTLGIFLSVASSYVKHTARNDLSNQQLKDERAQDRIA